MMQPTRYYNRDLSWLGFNYRVLQEAGNHRLPLYERIKFLAIFSANLDEFFRVRVSAIRNLLNVEGEKSGARKLLHAITHEVDRQQQEFGKIFNEQIIPALELEAIHLEMQEQFNETRRQIMKNYFQQEVIHLLEPVFLGQGHTAPFLQNGCIYLIIGMYRKNIFSFTGITGKRLRYAMVRVPEQLPRFFTFPVDKTDGQNQYCIAFLDDIIRLNLSDVFPGYQITSCHAIKLSRDADLHIEDEYSGNLVEKVRQSLSLRNTGSPARVLFDLAMPSPMLRMVKTCFNIKKQDLIPGSKYHNFSDFFQFPNPRSPELERIPLPPQQVPGLEQHHSMFEALKAQDWLLHFPYQSYDYVLRFLNEAAFDPQVREIKVTQYRVASNSAVVSALISAARNGKAVTVFVELKARFDEETNLRFAQQMEAAGIRIIYSIPGLKVHAKAVLVIRNSTSKSRTRRFAFISTGNFNEKTARLYADHGFFTSNPDITGELESLFEELETRRKTSVFKHIQVAQFNMVDTYRELIQREIEAAKSGQKGYIFLKVNNLEEQSMIDLLYEASEAGVEIDIIVRSVCCIIPGKKFSKNIRVRRIVDMYLEHARVFSVHNEGQPRVFIASADWMKRNLQHRIELGVEIRNPELKQELLDIYQIQMSDNISARLLDQNLQMHPVPQAGQKPVRAQEAIYFYLKNKYEKA